MGSKKITKAWQIGASYIHSTAKMESVGVHHFTQPFSSRCSILQFHPWKSKPSSNFDLHFLLAGHSLATVKYSRYDSDDDSSSRSSKRFNFNFRDEINDYEEEDGDYDKYSTSWKKKRRWWSESDEEDVDEEPEILESVFDSFWIFKVFKSYGWLLPPIIVSTLLATGPKAFLMALALPLGQSVFSFIFDKLRGKTKRRQNQTARMRRKPFAESASNVEDEEERGNKKMGYKSWAVDNNGQASKERAKGPESFGGWDELDSRASNRVQSQWTGKTRRTTAGKGKLSSRRGRKSDTPLLLRLLIAVFPMLGSWTRMF